MTEPGTHRAQALNAFLTWRPAPGGAPALAWRSVLISLLASASVCLLIALSTVLVPHAAGSGGWTEGARLLLFCHLA